MHTTVQTHAWLYMLLTFCCSVNHLNIMANLSVVLQERHKEFLEGHSLRTYLPKTHPREPKQCSRYWASLATWFDGCSNQGQWSIFEGNETQTFIFIRNVLLTFSCISLCVCVSQIITCSTPGSHVLPASLKKKKKPLKNLLGWEMCSILAVFWPLFFKSNALSSASDTLVSEITYKTIQSLETSATMRPEASSDHIEYILWKSRWLTWHWPFDPGAI